ncbi:alpha/beta fold hydrolase [Pseudonocardia sp. GCM10023141]|uniref:alpha/beta fold hydrolase n=1 Tax=Pseudonocardia sp. GCM10023141 TaxID=3252653 RepID=UPI003610EC72
MIEINADRRGSGTPLVLLHGIGHRWQAWEPVLDLLAEHHDVIAIDMPGFGLSPAMPDTYAHDLPGSTAMLRDVFAQLGIARPHVAGNSLGGLLAIEAAAQGLVASATALSPAGFWNPRDRARAFRILRGIRAGALAPAAARAALTGNSRLRAIGLSTLYAHPERIDRASALGDMDALRASTAFAPTLRAGRSVIWEGTQPTVPVTVAWGERDRILPLRQAARAAALLPGAQHVTLPGCGHVPMIDSPRLVAAAILATCARAQVQETEEPQRVAG